MRTCHAVAAAVNAGAPKHRLRATGISVQAHVIEQCASDALYVEYAKRRGHNVYVMPFGQVCLPYATSATKVTTSLARWVIGIRSLGHVLGGYTILAV